MRRPEGIILFDYAISMFIDPTEDTPALSQKINAQICRDTVEPHRELIASIQALPGKVGRDKYFLRNVISILLVAKQTITMGVDAWPELVIELGDRQGLLQGRGIAPQ